MKVVERGAIRNDATGVLPGRRKCVVGLGEYAGVIPVKEALLLEAVAV